MAEKGMHASAARNLIVSAVKALESDSAAKQAGSLIEATYDLIRKIGAASKAKKEFRILSVKVSRARHGSKTKPEVLFVERERDDGGDIPGGSWPFPFSGEICFPIPIGTDDDGDTIWVWVCLVWWFP